MNAALAVASDLPIRQQVTQPSLNVNHHALPRTSSNITRGLGHWRVDVSTRRVSRHRAPPCRGNGLAPGDALGHPPYPRAPVPPPLE